MTDARGKLGGQVFSKNRSGAYIRTKVTPSNAQTARQTFIRQALAQISANWSALTSAQRASFDGAVEGFTSTNVFGDVTKPTGKTLYTKLNLNLVNSVQAQITEAPLKVELPNIQIASVELDAGSLAINFTASQLGTVIVVKATAPQTAGTSFFKGKYRQIGVFTGVAGLQLDITAEYEEKFGAVVGTENISVEVIFVMPNGQATIPQSAVAIQI